MKKPALTGMILGIALLIAGSFWFYEYSKHHISTDDAQITGHLHPITPAFPVMFSMYGFMTTRPSRLGTFSSSLTTVSLSIR